VALGVGAVGVGVGGYFAWQSADYSSQADDVFVCDQRPLGCSLVEQREVRRLEDESGFAQTRAIVAFSVGGAVLATGVVLLAVSGSEPKDTASITPWIGYRQAGVLGRF
jgi:hypothetical protein